MTPEAKDYLAKAQADLDDARKIMGIPLAKIAARSAYYAVFHAAEALIIERTGKIAKTHAGVRTEFARVTKELPGTQPLLTFLGQAYMYKQISDYGVGQVVTITETEALQAIADADVFIAKITGWLTGTPRPSEKRS